MSLDDMRLFAKVAEVASFSEASRLLGIPKQTVSRRIQLLEQSLGVQLLQRTTRRLHLTEAGAAYADRCAEITRLAEDANRAVTDAGGVPMGLLRVTADPVFGEAFVTPLVIEYAQSWSQVSVEVLLTRRRVGLIEEGFDIGFRIGDDSDSTLTATHLGPARVRYCASPQYLAKHGTPESPDDLAQHECISVGSEAAPTRWPFRGRKSPKMVLVSGRLRFSSFAMARAAAQAGLGVAIFPEFACRQGIADGSLIPLLDAWQVDAGAIRLVHPTSRYLVPRVRLFVDLAKERLANHFA